MAIKKIGWGNVLLVLGILGCTGADLPTAATVEVGDGNNNQVVGLAHGQILVVSLEANPTTGYTWDVEEIDVSILSQLGEAQFQPESQLIGAGGIQTYRFLAQSAGRSELRLVYRRPWEQGVAPLRTFTLNVHVR